MDFSFLALNFLICRCQNENTVERCWYTCPRHWDLFRESCYFFETDTSIANQFEIAKTNCQNLGGYLVEIETKEEDDYIINKAIALGTTHILRHHWRELTKRVGVFAS